MPKSPLIGIPCNRMEIQDAPAHFVKDQYIRPLIEIAKCIPVLIPASGDALDFIGLAGKLDGLLLTGAASHVCPAEYGAKRTFREKDLDTERDATSLPLIREAIKHDIPLFAICRGFQEMNVACGGTLEQHVHKKSGRLDHRANSSLPVKERYEERRHKIIAQKGGMFQRLKLPHEFDANSLHHQGIEKLGESLFVEGISEDGLIEAVSIPGKRFILGTQWHPEGDFWLNPVSVKLFEEFGRAVRKN